MSMTNGKGECAPFLKWAGGKRWFVRRCLKTIPTKVNRYIEPFLGSGALFFALEPRRAVLSDLNADLVNTFLAIKNDWKSVAAALGKYHVLHSKHFYYQMRDSKPRSAVGQAAKFIYLNRTCWNGLYRVNVGGRFNVPIGSKDLVVLPTDDFEHVSGLLKGTVLLASDFEVVIDRAGHGDLIFADPPYVTAHSQNGFLKYNEKLFSWGDQVRLVKSLRAAKRRGARIVVTNADTPAIRKLYEGSFRVRTISRASIIAGSSAHRGMTNELVITSERD